MRVFRLLVFLMLFALAGESLALEVQLRPEAEVPGEMVTLADVAELSPQDDLSRSLQTLELFKSPAPGQSRSYSAREIRGRITRQVPSLTGLVLTGAQEIRVARASQLLGPDQVELLVRDSILGSDQLPVGSQVYIRSLNLPRPLVLPLGTVSTEVIPSDPRILGNSRFSLLVRVNNQLVHNISLRVSLEVLAPVVVAARDLQRGSVLEEADLLMQNQDVSALRNPVFDAAPLVGKTIKRKVRSGHALDLSFIDFPPTIARGDLVVLRIRQGALEITAQGEARQDGMVGETIRVRNSRSKKDVLGVVVAPGLVDLEY